MWWQSKLLEAITPVSHDHSEIIIIYWFAAQEKNILLLSMLKHLCCLMFEETIDTFFAEFYDE